MPYLILDSTLCSGCLHCESVMEGARGIEEQFISRQAYNDNRDGIRDVILSLIEECAGGAFSLVEMKEINSHDNRVDWNAYRPYSGPA